jgi:uncharacterized protein YggE
MARRESQDAAAATNTTEDSMQRSISAIALGACLLAGFALPAQAEDPPRTVTVTGEAEASGAPDIAVMTLGVTSEGASAAAALQANAAAMRQVVEAVRGQGIEARDLQTSSLSVQPRYAADPKSGAERPAIVGYVASNQVRVRVRNLAVLGGLIDRVVAAGSNEIRGLAFDLADRDRLLEGARRGAVRDAIRRAELYAAAGGVRLGEVMAIAEEMDSVAPRVMAAPALAAASVPVEAGEVVLRVQVKMVWRIAP